MLPTLEYYDQSRSIMTTVILPEQQAVGPVPLTDHGVLTEHQSGGSLLGSRQLTGEEGEMMRGVVPYLNMIPTMQAWIITPTMDWRENVIYKYLQLQSSSVEASRDASNKRSGEK